MALEVEDNGRGIPPDQLPGVFEPFAARGERPGGLDLSIARMIVERHGGRIVVESEEGVGTQFTLELPLVAPLEEESREAS